MTMLAAAAGAAMGLGVFLVVAGMRRVPRERSTDLSPGLWTRATRWWTGLSRPRRGWLLGALAAGVALAAITGWLAWLVLVPVVLVVIPTLLLEPPNREIEVLAGLDRWTRLVATSLTSGKSVRDAIYATRQQAPEVLAGPVGRLCARLEQRWELRDALFSMADELDAADADAVVAALAIAGTRGGQGARETLEALSNTIQDRLRALREVAAERAKPRVVARQVTVITLSVLGLALLFNSRFFEPYSSPLGQVIALCLAAAFLGCLVMIRRRTVPPPAPRFLRARP